MARFVDLSDDILYVILEHLHFRRSLSLCLLRLISTRFNSFAESVLYRNIVLQDDDQHEAPSYHFIERLSNPKDLLCRQVRSVQVKSFKGEEDSYCMNTTFFLACLNNIDRLKSFRLATPFLYGLLDRLSGVYTRYHCLYKIATHFTTNIIGTRSWDSDIALPDELLDMLHRRFPGAQLCATLRSLDQPLLTWSQINRLDVSLPLLNSTPATCLNLCKQLRDVILQCRSLRALSIDAHHDPTARAISQRHKQNTRDFAVKKNGMWRGDNSAKSISSDTVSSPNAFSIRNNELGDAETALNSIKLPLEPKHQLPPLEHLEIRTPAYSLELEHSRQLLESMDWKKLKHLKLAPSDPTGFFQTFMDRLPRLERLEFTYPDGRPNYFPSTSVQPRRYACSQFVASIPMLKEILIRCDVIESDDPLWNALAHVHGSHLRCLSIQAHHSGLEAPVWNGYSTVLLTCFSSLTTLDMALRISTSLPYSSCGCLVSHSYRNFWSKRDLYSIPIIPSLKSLRVSVKVNPCERPLFSHVIDHAHCGIKGLWAKYMNDAEKCELEEFTMVFWRWELKSPHPDENGLPRNTHVNTVIINSQLVGNRLIVRPRNQPEDHTMYYDKVWQGTPNTRKVIFVTGEAGSLLQTSAGK